jgi:hypothetical protein
MSKRVSRRTGAVVAMSLGFAAMGFSGSAVATEQWVVDNVRAVYPLGDGSFIITFVNPQPICTNTATYPYFWVSSGHNGVTAEGVRAMLATSLTALAAGKKMSLAFEASTPDCFVNRLSIAAS